MATTAVAPPPDDKTLARRATQRSNRAAFDELYGRHRNRILNTIRHYVGDAEDAEDVLGETFLKAWRHRKTFRGDSSFTTWLTRIAINECKMHHRRNGQRGRKAVQLLSVDSKIVGEFGEEMSVDIPVPDLNIEGLADRQRIGKVMAGMPVKFKEVLRLAFWEDRTTEEIMKLTGLTEPAVKSRKLRGRRHFEKAIKNLDTWDMT
jgi:RNA polymerase sigma-70 factor, ECF subfamily